MKNFILLIFLFLFSMTLVFAQNPIPNPSFETWASYGGSYPGQYPVSWQTSDSVYQALSFGSSGHSAVQELVDKCDSNYSIKLTTVSALGQVAPGVATIGNITGISGAVNGGVLDNTRHKTFKGCYKYTSGGAANVAVITALLLKHNASGGRDTIASVVKQIITTTAGMTSFADDFIYFSSASPDTMLIILASSPGLNSPGAVAGSILVVDSLAFSGIVSNVLENNFIKDIKVYPQPAAGEVLNIDVTFGHYTKSTYSLLDGLGRLVKTGDLQEKQQINISSLTNGIYTLAINSDSGEKLYTTRVTVRR